MRRVAIRAATAMMLAAGLVLMMAAGSHWRSKVPADERARVNPYADKPEAVAAGRVLFEAHCAKCHGEDALGRYGRPSLRGEEVRGAADGELFWLLRNGSTWKGMPSWSSLPEPERWQLIAYLRSLPPEPRQNSYR
ncbi:MAG TPA: c-type cytochrome [Terracidiphilus sp.]|nr:c-type cytochrome [Terracidiphilus sp.]